MNRGKDENKAKRRGIHSSASTEQISSRQKVLESFEETRMTPDERKAIIERGAERIMNEWDYLLNKETALLISEALWEAWENEVKN